MLPLALFNLAWEEGALMPLFCRSLVLKDFFEVVSVSFASLALGILIKLDRML